MSHLNHRRRSRLLAVDVMFIFACMMTDSWTSGVYVSASALLPPIYRQTLAPLYPVTLTTSSLHPQRNHIIETAVTPAMFQDGISSMWKIPFLLSVAYWFQYVYNPPSVVKKEEEGKHKRVKDFNSWSGGFIAWGQFAGKVGPVGFICTCRRLLLNSIQCAIWFTSLGEVLVILAFHSQYPSPSDPLLMSSYLPPTYAAQIRSILLPSPTSTATTPDPTAIRFTPLFWTGWTLTMFFGALRLASYAE